MAQAKKPENPVVAKLAATKKLLIALLMQPSENQDVVARILGINQSNVRRMLPSRFAKEVAQMTGRHTGAERWA